MRGSPMKVQVFENGKFLFNTFLDQFKKEEQEVLLMGIPILTTNPTIFFTKSKEPYSWGNNLEYRLDQNQ